jgi:hypothetical protein
MPGDGYANVSPPMTALERPIFVVGTPQAGTTYVFEVLGELPGVFSLDQRVRDVFDRAEEVRPALAGHDSHRRAAADAPPATVTRIRAQLAALLPEEPGEGGAPRVLDGAPRHALRIPFLDAIFPDAVFVYVYRSPRETIGGMVEAWNSGLYVTHPNLPDWPGPPWSMLLVPGWRELAGRSVAEIATAQWTTATRIMLDDLQALPPERWAVVDFAALLADPAPELERLTAVLELEWAELPSLRTPAAYILPPAGSQAVEDELQRLLPQTIGLAETAHDLLARPVSRRPTATPDFEAPTRSVHNAALARFLDRHGSSLLLATGSAGKLVCVRHDGARINTHFSDLPAPGALAVGSGEFAVATADEIQLYRDDPEGCGPAPEGSPRDACFVPTATQPIADAAAIAFAGGSIWAAVDSEIAPAAGDGAPPWRLPFGDDAGETGWRVTGFTVGPAGPQYACAEPAGDPGSGCVIDCATGEIIAEGLSGPRAPRLGDERLWLVERDVACLASIDLRTRESERVADLPGWPQGLAIVGSAALVALSRNRPAEATSAGEPAEPYGGVALIDLASGDEAGYLRFATLPEVLDVAVLRHRYPEVGRRY